MLPRLMRAYYPGKFCHYIVNDFFYQKLITWWQTVNASGVRRYMEGCSLEFVCKLKIFFSSEDAYILTTSSTLNRFPKNWRPPIENILFFFLTKSKLRPIWKIFSRKTSIDPYHLWQISIHNFVPHNK